MHKADVQIGGRYAAKVSGVICTLRITGVSAFSGWNAINERTGKQVHVRSAQRLRHPVAPPRCGKCPACLRVLEVKRQGLAAMAQARTEGRSVAEDVRIIWNAALRENPCEDLKERE